MALLAPLRKAQTDDSLRFAILLGLATIPFTLLLSSGSVSISSGGVVIGSSISGEPLLLAGLLVGYYYSNRSTESRRAGLWTGLVGSIATVLVFVVTMLPSIADASLEMTAVAVVLIPIAIAIGAGLSALITMIVAVITDRVTTRLRNRNRSDTGETPEPAASSNWWRAVPVYALLAPIVLLSVWLESLDSGVGVVTFLGLLILVPLSIVALVALFIDATEPRTDWIPSVGIYVGIPIALYALVYLASASQGRMEPSGDAWYGFIVALWIVAAVYLADRYRHIGTLQFR
ncbi:DUF5518 domain-containing protein [Halocatena salina]|uniref:DUF5518 domain-containing protein n=1 Tax=Halocatena salina TaxID=2934340 RepID=A0A8U0A1R2_9EURY|nr:DUF5518 domain-containing protein [Halocatena salina]UPM42388.1 DUF5518 domain-containing protein [Halocatena salina]